MAQTPAYALPYPVATDPADIPADLKRLADQVALVLGGALSATPPAAPIDGQLWALPAAAGVVWLFRYNPASASAYKWEFVGGSDLTSEDASTIAITGTIGSQTPQVTVPRAGDYVMEWGFNVYNPSGAYSLLMGIEVGGATPPNEDQIALHTAGANLASVGARRRLKTGLTAGAVLSSRYSVGGGTGNTRDRWLAVRPLRVS